MKLPVIFSLYAGHPHLQNKMFLLPLEGQCMANVKSANLGKLKQNVNSLVGDQT